jgi:hypothetical protein
MNTMQDMITGEVEQLVTGAGLTMVKAPQYANTGTLHAMRGVEPVLAIGYGIFDTYATLTLSGPAVEQAPFEFLAAQHRLRHNRVCRGVVPVIAYNTQITPENVADRRGLTIQFHSLKFGKPGEVQEFLGVVRELLPEAPGTAGPADEVGREELDRLAALVLQRPDAAEALRFVLAQLDGGPSCRCGGDHWNCDFGAGDPETPGSTWTASDADELARLEAAFAEAGGRGADLAGRIDALRALRDAQPRPQILVSAWVPARVTRLVDAAEAAELLRARWPEAAALAEKISTGEITAGQARENSEGDRSNPLNPLAWAVAATSELFGLPDPGRGDKPEDVDSPEDFTITVVAAPGQGGGES